MIAELFEFFYTRLRLFQFCFVAVGYTSQLSHLTPHIVGYTSQLSHLTQHIVGYFGDKAKM